MRLVFDEQRGEMRYAPFQQLYAQIQIKCQQQVTQAWKIVETQFLLGEDLKSASTAFVCGSIINIQMFVDEGKIKTLNKRVSSLSNFKLVIEETKDKLNINLLKECPRSINRLARRINKREGAKVEIKAQGEHWLFGEKKLFFWILLFYSHFHSIPLLSLQEHHLSELASFFPQKSRFFLSYEIRSLACALDGTDTGKWSEEEHAFLLKAAGSNEEQQQNWRLIALEIYRASQGRIFRSLRDCREHWRNYLNPKLARMSWSNEEDVELFELIVKHGCRWSLIAKEINYKRSEHTIKNRFNTLLRHSSSKNTSFSNHIRFAKSQLTTLRNKLRRSQIKAEQRREMQEIEVIDEREESEERVEKGKNQPGVPIGAIQELFLINEEEDNYMDQIIDLREQYEFEKQERGTADDDDLGLLFPPLVCKDPLLECSQERIQRISADANERKRFEQELAKALGCHHYERLKILSEDEFPQDSNSSYAL